MNCKAGDIAKIIRSEAGNEGRQLAVLEPISYEAARAIDPRCVQWRLSGFGPLWLVQPLQPLRIRSLDGEYLGTLMERCVFPDSSLKPIPGDGLGDETPNSEELPQAVGA